MPEQLVAEVAHDALADVGHQVAREVRRRGPWQKYERAGSARGARTPTPLPCRCSTSSMIGLMMQRPGRPSRPRRPASPPARRRTARDTGGRTAAGAGARSLGEPVLQQHPQRDEAVAPGDLLALFVAAAVVGDRHFVDAVAALEDLRRQLRLDAEAVRTPASSTAAPRSASPCSRSPCPSASCCTARW